MAWNEPGNEGNGKDEDPWGKKKKEGPPDLDEVLKNMSNKIKGFFGGGGKGGGGSNGSSKGGGVSGFSFVWILVIGLIVWAATGFYIVQPAEEAVVLRFGVPVDTKQPGPHWHLPTPIEKIEKVDTGAERGEPFESLMMTADRYMVHIRLTVNYKISDPETFLFNVRKPVATLSQAVDSALREVIGSYSFESILTGNKARRDVVDKTRKLLQKTLNGYKSGIRITKVNLIDLLPPPEVKPAYDEANSAKNIAGAFIEQALKYKAKIVNEAKGEAAALLEAAKAYKVAVEEKAKGETRAFTKVLVEYEKAPAITRKRLYIETMQEVLSKVRKVMVKLKQGNNMLLLPLDRYLGRGKTTETK